MRLHHANELALAQSVRIQELAALAGHELVSVVTNIADQARTMLEASGVVCWAFDTEGRVSATRGSGDPSAEQVLAYASTCSADGSPLPRVALTRPSVSNAQQTTPEASSIVRAWSAMLVTTLTSSWPARAASSWMRTDWASASSLAWCSRIVRSAMPTTVAEA